MTGNLGSDYYSYRYQHDREVDVRTVQMTLEPDLVVKVDRIARRLGLTRSAFTRRALHAAIEHQRIQEMERRHREGYRRKPVRRGELTAWTREQVWPD